MSPSNDDPVPHKRFNEPCCERFPPNNDKDAAQHRRKRASNEDKRFVLVLGQNVKYWTILILSCTSAELFGSPLMQRFDVQCHKYGHNHSLHDILS